SIFPTSHPAFTLYFHTTDDTATSPDDYLGTPNVVGEVDVPPNCPSYFLRVYVVADSKAERNETFLVTLDSAQGAAIGYSPQAIRTIIDDDLSTLSVANPLPIQEGNSGDSYIPFVVSLSSLTNQNVTFHYATRDHTATISDNDYRERSGDRTIT